MSDETRDLEDCITDAKESLVENLEGQENYLRRHGADNTVSESIHECADSAVPVYTADIIDVFRSDSGLWYETPDSGFEGCESIMAAMTMMIYEAITAALYEYANELEDDELVCEADGCDEEDDHDVSADDAVLCKAHCGGLETCDDCREEAEQDAEAESDIEFTAENETDTQDADLRAKDEIREEEAKS